MTPDEKAARVEQIKLLATTVNTVGVAIIVSGAVVPTIAILYGSDRPQSPYWLALAASGLLVGALFHIIARSILGGIGK